jgi:hypothetical protein
MSSYQALPAVAVTTRSMFPIRGNGKQDLATIAVALASKDFANERIVPLLRDDRAYAGQHYAATVVQNSGTGRLTLKYHFDPGTTVIAKMFTDDLGPRSFQAITHLWNSGFNRQSPCQVPEPLAFYPDLNFLLMRYASGDPVRNALDRESDLNLAECCRRAAEFLVELHRSKIIFGNPEAEWHSLKLFRLATRVIKAAAAQPEHLEMIRSLFRQVNDRVLKLPARRRLVQTHGRYHHDHVFISPAATVVIDLDRCCPSDPGKDVAEFVSVLRSTCFKHGGDMARVEEATSAFLREYLAHVPEAEITAGCYWAVAVLHDLLSGLKKCRGNEHRSWAEIQEFYLSEINRALELGS